MIPAHSLSSALFTVGAAGDCGSSEPSVHAGGSLGGRGKGGSADKYSSLHSGRKQQVQLLFQDFHRKETYPSISGGYSKYLPDGSRLDSHVPPAG